MQNGKVDRIEAGLEVLDVRHSSPEASVSVGTLVEVDPDGGLRVASHTLFEGDTVSARSTVRLGRADVGRQVVMAFEEGDQSRPIILGVLQTQFEADREPDEAVGLLSRSSRRQVRVNGRQVQIEADDELVLQCGKSTILLRADGQIYVKGMKIVSRARGIHKIKGGNVLIN